MATGVITYYSEARGYGFAKVDDGGPDVFVGNSDFADDGLTPLMTRGQVIEFTITDTPKGPRAEHIRVIASDRRIEL